jgi:hypothetical protein
VSAIQPEQYNIMTYRSYPFLALSVALAGAADLPSISHDPHLRGTSALIYSRKTECGAKQLLTCTVARAAPFALLKDFTAQHE